MVFSLISNDHLAKQALNVHSAISSELEKQPDNEQLQGVIQKAFDAYKFHAESMNDSVKYYAQIHGNQAQTVLEEFLALVPDEAPTEAPTEA